MPAKKRKRKPDVRKTTKGKNRNFRTTKEGAGMTKKGVAAYRRKMLICIYNWIDW